MTTAEPPPIPFRTFRPTPLAVATIAGGLLLVLAAILVARWSTPAFVAVGATLIAVVAAAALRWPRPVVVLVVLSPVIDRYLIGGVVAPQVGTLPNYFSEAVLIAVTAVIVARAARAGRLAAAVRHPSTLALLAFVALAVVSAVVNRVPPAVAFAGLAFTLDATLCFFLPRLVGFNRRESILAVAAFFGVVLAAGLVALAQAILSPTILGLSSVEGRFGELYRLGSFLYDPNTLGAFLVAASPFAIFASTGLARPRWRAVALGLAFLLILSLWMSFSRGAWLALILGAGSVAALVDRRTLVVAATVTALAFATAVLMPRNLLVPTNGGDGQPPPRPDLIDSTVGRLGAVGEGRDLRTLFVLNALPILAEHPLLGVGPGRYGGAAADIFGTPVYEEYGTDELFTFDLQSTVDNFWLHLAVESGALGTAAFVAAALLAGVPILLAARRRSGRRGILVAGIAAATASLAFNSVTTMLLEANSAAFTFWFLLGLGSLAVEERRLELAAGEDLPPRPRQEPKVEPE